LLPSIYIPAAGAAEMMKVPTESRIDKSPFQSVIQPHLVTVSAEAVVLTNINAIAKKCFIFFSCSYEFDCLLSVRKEKTVFINLLHDTVPISEGLISHAEKR